MDAYQRRYSGCETMPRGFSKWLVVSLLVITVSTLSLTATGWAQGEGGGESTGTPSGAALQAASWIATIPYGAFKTGFAIVGSAVGGLAYVFSGGNLDSAKSVWTTTMYGTYVLTPEHLKGQKPIRFLGVPERAPEVAVNTKDN